jgi:hypothetical protein
VDGASHIQDPDTRIDLDDFLVARKGAYDHVDTTRRQASRNDRYDMCRASSGDGKTLDKKTNPQNFCCFVFRILDQ